MRGSCCRRRTGSPAHGNGRQQLERAGGVPADPVDHPRRGALSDPQVAAHPVAPPRVVVAQDGDLGHSVVVNTTMAAVASGEGLDVDLRHPGMHRRRGGHSMRTHKVPQRGHDMSGIRTRASPSSTRHPGATRSTSRARHAAGSIDSWIASARACRPRRRLRARRWRGHRGGGTCRPCRSGCPPSSLAAAGGPRSESRAPGPGTVGSSSSGPGLSVRVAPRRAAAVAAELR